MSLYLYSDLIQCIYLVNHYDDIERLILFLFFVNLQEITIKIHMDKGTNLNLSFDQPNPHSFSFAGNSQSQQQNTNKEKIDPLRAFLKEQHDNLKANSYNISDQYIQWQNFLNQNRNQIPTQVFVQYLNQFLQYFPFTRKYWQQWILLKKTLLQDTHLSIMKSGQDNNQNQFDFYQKSLLKNPKCFQIWEQYINLLHEKMLQNSESQGDKSTTPVHSSSTSPALRIPNGSGVSALIFRKQLQRAIIQIGADNRSGQLYKYYYPLLSEAARYQFYKKVFTRCLTDLEQFYEMFQKWLKLDCSDQTAKTLYFRENKGNRGSNASTIDSSTMEAIREFLKMQVTKIYDKTIAYRDRKLEYDAKIKLQYFQDRFVYQQSKSYDTTHKYLRQIDKKMVQDDLEAYHQLINFQRQNGGTIENISYRYEKVVMIHSDNLQMWEDTFHYLQNETGKYLKVLSILRNNQVFFLSYPSRDIYFYWCDLEERQNPKKARAMYERLHNYYIGTTAVIPISLGATFEILMRQIQFQIRTQQLTAAKQIFDQTLAHYCSHLSLYPTQKERCNNILAHAVVEYCNFVVRFYRDFQYPKKLYKMYFQFLPFNKFLFIEYLDFMKNFQNRQGYYDELMSVIMLGLTKAKQEIQIARSAQFHQIVKIVKQVLRSLLGSIYLIKISQRKVMQAIQAQIHQ